MLYKDDLTKNESIVIWAKLSFLTQFEIKFNL